MRLQDGMRGLPIQSRWRFFPWWVAGCMSVVIAVNAYMAWSALHTFPGQAGRDGFDLSNRYDSVIARVQQQAALGWTVRALADETGHPVLALTDATGAPLAGAAVDATAERPLGDPLTTHLAFQEAAPGRYAADETLPAKGQWDVMLTVTAQGRDVTTTRRIVVR
jgi:nitrogen fixation protein FixH